MNGKQMEEIKRHFGVVAESLRSDIRQIAEGHGIIRHEIQEHRREVRDEFKEIREWPMAVKLSGLSGGCESLVKLLTLIL